MNEITSLEREILIVLNLYETHELINVYQVKI